MAGPRQHEGVEGRCKQTAPPKAKRVDEQSTDIPAAKAEGRLPRCAPLAPRLPVPIPALVVDTHGTLGYTSPDRGSGDPNTKSPRCRPRRASNPGHGLLGQLDKEPDISTGGGYDAPVPVAETAGDPRLRRLAATTSRCFMPEEAVAAKLWPVDESPVIEATSLIDSVLGHYPNLPLFAPPAQEPPPTTQ